MFPLHVQGPGERARAMLRLAKQTNIMDSFTRRKIEVVGRQGISDIFPWNFFCLVAAVSEEGAVLQKSPSTDT